MTALHFPLTGWFRPNHPDDPGGTASPCDAQVAARLADWRHLGHRSVRILDLSCGNGTRLIHAAARARELGFVSIEGFGVDRSPGNIRRARHHALTEAHPSTELVFAIGEPICALAGEHDGAADIVLMSDPRPYPSSPLGAALDRVCAGFVLARN